MNEERSLEFGYVRILSGLAKGRIGRHMGIDKSTGKAKVSFGYENDFLTYTNGHLFAPASISNDINKQDLIDRYYIIVNELNKVDIRGHAKIKKYSAGHTSLITECNIVRGLLNEYISLKYLSKMKFVNNIIILMSFQDILWCNDFVLDLEMKKFFVAAIHHEVFYYEHDLDMALQLCSNFIFILSNYSTDSNWLASDYQYIKSRIDSSKQRIHFVRMDETPAPSYAKNFFGLGKQYTQEYDNELGRLACSLDF